MATTSWNRYPRTTCVCVLVVWVYPVCSLQFAWGWMLFSLPPPPTPCTVLTTTTPSQPKDRAPTGHSSPLLTYQFQLYIRKRTSKYFCSMLFSSFLFFSFPLFFKCASKWELSASCLEPLCFSGGWWGFNADNHSPIQQRTPYGTINLKAGGPQSTDSQLNSTSFGLE